MVWNVIRRSLQGSNLEIFKFGIYLSFPIGWMYYFGTNLDERFSIPDFWPKAEHSHKLPQDTDELKKEVDRIRMQIQTRKKLEAARAVAATEAGGSAGGGGGGS